MRNRDLPAFPTVRIAGAKETFSPSPGLSKLEYAAIQIAANGNGYSGDAIYKAHCLFDELDNEKYAMVWSKRNDKKDGTHI